jgi:hypothetical protein
MEHLECPPERTWSERRCWFEKVEEDARGEGSYLVSEQACALIAEVQCTFCAGAWVAVIILVMSVIDAQLRETELLDFKGGMKGLLELTGANPDTEKLRKRRNSLVHVRLNDPAITVDQQWCDRPQLEKDARKAVELMFDVFYMSPGI